MMAGRLACLAAAVKAALTAASHTGARLRTALRLVGTQQKPPRPYYLPPPPSPPHRHPPVLAACSPLLPLAGGAQQLWRARLVRAL